MGGGGRRKINENVIRMRPAYFVWLDVLLTGTGGGGGGGGAKKALNPCSCLTTNDEYTRISQNFFLLKIPNMEIRENITNVQTCFYIYHDHALFMYFPWHGKVEH